MDVAATLVNLAIAVAHRAEAIAARLGAVILTCTIKTEQLLVLALRQ